MKLWHDDIRRPPDDTWTWARRNVEAKTLLSTHGINVRDDGVEWVTTISLDHDLGLHDENPDTEDAWLRIGGGEETGLDLIDWMIEYGLVPKMVHIHSMNSVGAGRMKATLMSAANRGLIPHHLTLSVEPYRRGRA